jgi:putative nucleotidyltransferase with HDIG domain
MDLRTNHPGKSELRTLIDLPPLPAVAMRVLGLVAKESVGLKELSDVLRSDVALSSEILILANSALFSIRSEVCSILHASVLLGLKRVKALALTVAMRAYLTDALKIPALLACWHHSLATALIAEEVADVSLVDKDTAYTAGMMHDIGRLALAILHGAKYAELLRGAPMTPVEALERERERFGLDHCEAGRRLVNTWNLPKEFADFTAHHHQEPNGKLDEIAVLQLSCRLADALGFRAHEQPTLSTLDEILQKFPERERSRFHPDLSDFTLRIATKINSMQ